MSLNGDCRTEVACYLSSVLEAQVFRLLLINCCVGAVRIASPMQFTFRSPAGERLVKNKTQNPNKRESLAADNEKHKELHICPAVFTPEEELYR